MTERGVVVESKSWNGTCSDLPQTFKRPQMPLPSKRFSESLELGTTCGGRDPEFGSQRLQLHKNILGRACWNCMK